MKKWTRILLAMSLVGALLEGGEAKAKAAEGTAEIAMVTDIGAIDDKSFNQGAWEGSSSTPKPAADFHLSAHRAEHRIYLDHRAGVNGGAKVVVPWLRLKPIP